MIRCIFLIFIILYNWNTCTPSSQQLQNDLTLLVISYIIFCEYNCELILSRKEILKNNQSLSPFNVMYYI
jgi:hypothetical protein